MLLALVPALVTLAVSLVMPACVKRPLERWGVIDIPNERSSHERPVLRGVGLAVLVAVVAGGAVAIALFSVRGSESTDWKHTLIVLAGAVAAGALGFREDLRGLSVAVRGVSLLVIAAAVSSVLLWGMGTLRADIPLLIKVALVVYAVLFISSYINVANFMDGLNGISGLHGVLAGSVFAVAGAAAGSSWLVVTGLIIAAGFLGFLPWNLWGAGAFLGDVGSYLLGGLIAMTSFAALVAGVPMLTTIGPMVIYFGDVAVTLLTRLRDGKRWYEPHKEHVYQKIQQLGYSHVHASLIVTVFSLIVSVLGLLQLVAPGYWPILLLAGAVVLSIYLLLPRFLPKRHARVANGL